MNSRIREIRSMLHLSQEQFGKELGIKKSAVSQIERGINHPTEQLILLLCASFNINENWLRTGKGEMFQVKDTDAALAEFCGRILTEEKSSNRRNLLIKLSMLSEEECTVLNQLLNKKKE